LDLFSDFFETLAADGDAVFLTRDDSRDPVTAVPSDRLEVAENPPVDPDASEGLEILRFVPDEALTPAAPGIFP